METDADEGTVGRGPSNRTASQQHVRWQDLGWLHQDCLGTCVVAFCWVLTRVNGLPSSHTGVPAGLLPPA
jgi:hypothetical protein